MEIVIHSLLAGARAAEGIAVIIDVFRAFSTAPVALARGAAKIILVADHAAAIELRDRGTGDLCMGEIDGRRPDGFDLGNSPSELSRVDVAGKVLIHATQAGTVGVNAAVKAEAIYAASLMNAAATAGVIRRRNPRRVTICAMGVKARERSDEDEQCALYLRNLLRGLRPSPGAVRSLVLAGAEARKFENPSTPWYSPEDREIALHLDSIPFAIRVEREDDLLVARRAPVSSPEAIL